AAKVLLEYKKLRVRITGHTDGDGDRENNVKLSQARADSVKTYLVGKGVDASRIETRGAGPDEPVADNDTPAGKQKNRRIELQLIQ
ncbi:MAG: OmpA family protein, partial [Polyangiaceae bacterium]|nr:OmpA family protein [Polyangiaceae bacterium]